MANLEEMLANPALLDEEAKRVAKLCMEKPAAMHDMNEGIRSEAEFLERLNQIGKHGGYEGLCSCGEEDL